MEQLISALPGLLRAAGLGVAGFSAENEPLIWTPALAELCRWDPSEPPPYLEAFIGLVHPGDQEFLRKGGPGVPLNLRTHPDLGPVRRLRATWLGWEGGPLGARLILVQDYSERLRTEDALRESQQLLQRMEKMNAVASLGAGLAHDLNNLIGVAKNYAELAEMDLEDGKPVDPMFLTRVKEATTRAGELTAQLMAYGRGQGLKEQRFDVHLRLGTLTSLLRSVVPPLVTLRVDAGQEMLWLEADPTQFDQIVANLVLNARDAMPHGGTIQIRLSHGTDSLGRSGIVLDVMDDGQGMPAEVVARLGEPFFTTKGGGKGTGLGLASVRTILEQLGGTFAVSSEVGKGTAFRLWLPEAV